MNNRDDTLQHKVHPADGANLVIKRGWRQLNWVGVCCVCEGSGKSAITIRGGICHRSQEGYAEKKREKIETDSANASGTQALTLRGLSNPGMLHLGAAYRETVSRHNW